MRYMAQEAADLPDLRAFREGLSPCLTLREVEDGTGIDKSALSRIETGRKVISRQYARRLAQFYSQATGRSVTPGEVLDMAELALNRYR